MNNPEHFKATENFYSLTEVNPPDIFDAKAKNDLAHEISIILCDMHGIYFPGFYK